MNNELKGITKEDVKGYAEGFKYGVLLMAKIYDIELTEEVKEKLEKLIKITSLK